MTREQFREWFAQARVMFARDGQMSTVTRAFADSVRPHDPELADLYVKCAEANEAVRRHLMRQT